VSHHGGRCNWDAVLKKPSSISAFEILLLQFLLDLATPVAAGMVRPQELDLLGMFVVLLCLAEFISDGNLEPPLPSAVRKAAPRSSA
jgi:hypothetical protein